jgi:hypothetical protein
MKNRAIFLPKTREVYHIPFASVTRHAQMLGLMQNAIVAFGSEAEEIRSCPLCLPLCVKRTKSEPKQTLPLARL